MTPEEFKARRLKLGYGTRRELAEAMGITRYAIEHYEYGRRPVPRWAQKLLDCLKLTQLADKDFGIKA
jgi:transcriptional regulator with XRE-family HTH domain